MATFRPPSSVLIVGSGVFGLSTAWALAQRPEWAATSITVLDRTADFPAADSASIDSSRIVRADYADPAYAALAAEAQAEWRKPGPDSFGGEGRYSETGFLLAADAAPLARPDGVKTSMGYARAAHANTLRMARAAGRPDGFVEALEGPADIARASGTGAPFGDWGYLNRGAGWADAEAAMRWLHARVAATGRVRFVTGTVERLETEGRRVVGVRLRGGGVQHRAELVVLAAGAWTPSLLDLRGQAVATGQPLAYMPLTEAEQRRLGRNPVLMNMSHGTFLITPSKRLLKVGHHSYGYQNPTTISTALVVPGTDGASSRYPEITVSQPYTHLDSADLWIPPSGERVLREGLRRMVPWPDIAERPWSGSRLCWYTDTATGDFLIAHHPHWEGLFVATGGSGHGFKFLPVLGDKIADCVAGRTPAEFRDKWAWRETVDVGRAILTEDGSRSGKLGLTLQDELRKRGPRL